MNRSCFYEPADLRAAKRAVRRRIGALASALIVFLAGYVYFILLRLQWAMLALLLAAFVLTLFFSAMVLLPAVRYLRFLREMEKGIHRKLDCRIVSCSDTSEMQDGVRVFPLEIVLVQGGDTRIMYIDAAKREHILPIGPAVTLHSYGRHIIGIERSAPEQGRREC